MEVSNSTSIFSEDRMFKTDNKNSQSIIGFSKFSACLSSEWTICFLVSDSEYPQLLSSDKENVMPTGIKLYFKVEGMK